MRKTSHRRSAEHRQSGTWRSRRTPDRAGCGQAVATGELKRSPMPQKPIIIAQISDLHIKAPGTLAYGRVDTARALERCVATLNQFTPKPDLVVISGDLADTPTEEEYAHLKRLLAPLNVAFAGIPGNHDQRDMMRAAFAQAADAFPSGPLNQRIEIGGPVSVVPVSTLPGKRHRAPPD